VDNPWELGIDHVLEPPVAKRGEHAEGKDPAGKRSPALEREPFAHAPATVDKSKDRVGSLCGGVSTSARRWQRPLPLR
jgi:hypothetical protein